MIKENTILVLGSGQIGLAACNKILERRPRQLILHALTEEEAKTALKKLKSIQNTGIKMKSSWGNVFALNSGFGVKGKDESIPTLDEINYLIAPKTPGLIESSCLWKLIEKHKPDLIVDGINTATAVGYKQDPYTALRELCTTLKQKNGPETNNIKEKIENIALSQAIPKLIRFTQVLHDAMKEFNVKRYVKISTSGLGGMGLNISYTHGDVGEEGLSGKLLGKVSAAGISNQLLWTLSHTPGLDVKVIIPTTLVGWEGISTKVRLRTETVPVIDCKQTFDLADKNSFKNEIIEELGEDLEMTVIDSGENGHYAIGDMTAITTLGQMGCITKEEVGIAVVETLEGSTKYDILTALDLATLGPSFNAGFQREYILSEMRKKEKNSKYKSIACGNLGPKVTKHLWELEILRRIDHSLESIIKHDSNDLALKAKNLVLTDDAHLRRQLLSLRMPILLDDKYFLIGKKSHLPKDGDLITIFETFKEDKENFEYWVENGWIDLREARIKNWQEDIKEVLEKAKEYSKSPVDELQLNWQSIALKEDFDVGEVLGFIYSIKGGSRKLY